MLLGYDTIVCTSRIVMITICKMETVILSDSTASRRDSFRLLQSVLMNVKGLYVSCKFSRNVKLLMYDEL